MSRLVRRLRASAAGELPEVDQNLLLREAAARIEELVAQANPQKHAALKRANYTLARELKRLRRLDGCKPHVIEIHPTKPKE